MKKLCLAVLLLLMLMMTVSAASAEGMYVTGVSVSGGTASVSYRTDRDSVLTLDILKEDGTLYRSYQKDVSRGSGTAAFSGVETPQYFTPRAVLQGAASDDRSKDHTSYLYTEQTQKLLGITPDNYTEAYPESQIVQLNDESAFMVLSDEIKVIRTGTDMTVTVPEDSGSTPESCVIGNATAEVKGLSAGDRICLVDENGRSRFGSNPVFSKEQRDDYYRYFFINVKSISVSGDTVTLEAYGETDGFIHDLLHFNSGRLKGELTVPIDKTFTHKNLTTDEAVTLKGAIKITVEFQIAWDIYLLKKNTAYFYFNLSGAVAGQDGDPLMSVTLNGNFEDSFEVPLPGISIVGIPGIMEVGPHLEFPVTLKDAAGTFGFTFGSGFWVEAATGEKTNQESYELDSDFQLTDMEGEATVGVYPGIGLTFIEFIAEVDAGNLVNAVVKAKLCGGETAGGSANDDRWHACVEHDPIAGDIKKCVSGTFGVTWGYRWKATLLSIFSDHMDLDLYTGAKEKWPWYRSLTYKDGAFNKACPHWGWRTDITVVDGWGRPLPDMTVNIANLSDTDHYPASGVTGSDGKVRLYLPDTTETNLYKASTVYSDPERGKSYTAEESFSVDTATTSLTLVIPNRQTIVRFLDVTSGMDPENMPPEMHIQEGETFRIQETPPTKYGFTFLGWDRDRHAEVPAVHPGDEQTAQGEYQVYYAIWSLNTYTTTFDAKGGVPQPDPIKVHEDERLRIPGTILPKLAGYNFLGWSKDPDAHIASFVPGEWYDPQNKDSTLYAVYEYIPLIYCLVTYDANGGTDAPPVQYVAAGQPFSITSGAPTREGCTLWGWSRTPDPSGDDEVYPGGYELTTSENMTLYAIWTENPVITYVITYDAGPGKNAPAAQYVPERETVRLRTQVPTYEAHKFACWGIADSSSTWKPGEWFGLRRTVTLIALWDTDYRITRGNGSTWYRDSKKGLQLKCNGQLSLFEDLEIDGQPVPKEAYTLSEGSTVVLLSREWLDTLYNGKHKVRFLYEDGESNTAKFSVAPQTPVTGDGTPLALYGLLLCVAAAVPVITLKKKKG